MRELLPLDESALTHGDLRPATAAIDGMRRAGDADAALDALLHLASIAWGLSTDPDPGHLIAEAARAFRLDPDEPRALLLTAVTRPAEGGDDVIARIRDHVSLAPDDALGAWHLGYALNLCGEIEPAADYLQRAVDGFRARGNRALLPHALMALSWICFLQRTVRAGPGCHRRVHHDRRRCRGSRARDGRPNRAGLVRLARGSARPTATRSRGRHRSARSSSRPSPPARRSSSARGARHW